MQYLPLYGFFHTMIKHPFITSIRGDINFGYCLRMCKPT